MRQAEIQRQYDEVIAPHYDRDPLSVISRSLARVLAQLKVAGCLAGALPAMNVLDVGIGTGLFCERLRDESARILRPFGLDISRQMIEVARTRIPDLVAEVDDAANIAARFTGTSFDLVCTHFVTGFVPMTRLAPEIFAKLTPGGYWSFVGATSQGFPKLQQLARSPLIKTLFGGQVPNLSELKTPADQSAVEKVLRSHSFEVCKIETFQPELRFCNFDEFMAFGWKGGWLTPFIEDVGLQNAKRLTRVLLNQFVFPVKDSHRIVIALARKPLTNAVT
jgi:ubiquinone/menaquinone biosynthesis C-methylase UbiE